MKTSKYLAFFAILTIVVCLLFSCKTADKQSVTVILQNGNETLLNEKVNINPAVTAMDAVVIACDKKGISYEKKDGFIDKFKGVEAKGNFAWMLYINGNLSSVGAEEYKLANGDEIKFSYEDWSLSMPKE